MPKSLKTFRATFIHTDLRRASELAGITKIKNDYQGRLCLNQVCEVRRLLKKCIKSACAPVALRIEKLWMHFCAQTANWRMMSLTKSPYDRYLTLNRAQGRTYHMPTRLSRSFAKNLRRHTGRLQNGFFVIYKEGRKVVWYSVTNRNCVLRNLCRRFGFSVSCVAQSQVDKRQCGILQEMSRVREE